MAQSYAPNGNISPNRFVKADTTTTGGYVVQAGAGDPVLGVSQPGTRQAPLSGLDDTYAGVAGGPHVEVATPGDRTWLQTGGAVTWGDYLKSDSSGRGVTASSDGDWYGARALQTGTAADQLVEVEIIIGMRGA